MYCYKNSKQVLQSLTSKTFKFIQASNTFSAAHLHQTVIQVNDTFRAESFNWGLQLIFFILNSTLQIHDQGQHFFFSFRKDFIVHSQPKCEQCKHFFRAVDFNHRWRYDSKRVMQLPLELQINHRWWYDSNVGTFRAVDFDHRWWYDSNVVTFRAADFNHRCEFNQRSKFNFG